MSTQLYNGENFSLTRFWGGDKAGVLYQITQYNETKRQYNWIQLNKKDVQLIPRRIKTCHIS